MIFRDTEEIERVERSEDVTLGKDGFAFDEAESFGMETQDKPRGQRYRPALEVSGVAWLNTNSDGLRGSTLKEPDLPLVFVNLVDASGVMFDTHDSTGWLLQLCGR